VLSTQKERIEKHPKKKARLRNLEVIECIEGHYEPEKVPFGRVYRWCTECVVAQCACGQRVTLTCSRTVCPGCGTDHAAIVEKWLPLEWGAAKADEVLLHPWRQARDCDDGESLPC
jgi:hypothetical protein